MNYLVIDAGGTAIKYALMNEDSNFIDKGEKETPLNSINEFMSTIEELVNKYENLEGIALSLPGRIDSNIGFAYSGGALTYNSKQNIKKIVSDKFKLRVSVENDGKCAALAEAWKGSLSQSDDGIVVLLGTGIGGGIIKDKTIHRGKNFIAGEFSFIIANTDIEKSDKIKTFSQQCSVVTGLCWPVADKKKIDRSKVTGKVVFEMARKGDSEVIKILDNYCYKLTLMLFNLQHIYDPEKIAIGGGISAQKVLFDYISKNIKYLEQNLEHKLSIPQIVKCKFGNDANLIGALYHFQTLYNCSTKK